MELSQESIRKVAKDGDPGISLCMGGKSLALKTEAKNPRVPELPLYPST